MECTTIRRRPDDAPAKFDVLFTDDTTARRNESSVKDVRDFFRYMHRRIKQIDVWIGMTKYHWTRSTGWSMETTSKYFDTFKK